MRLLATYLDRWDRQPFSGGEVYSYAGNFDAGARPRWRASGHIDWHSGPWMASYAAEYIGSYSETVGDYGPFDIFFDSFVRRVDPVLYHDIEAAFTFDSRVTVRAAITNVTDEDPPYLDIAPANTDVATYRLLGRSRSAARTSAERVRHSDRPASRLRLRDRGDPNLGARSPRSAAC